ncbi:MAG: HAMP domain-containing sensor histidine kinase [Bradyrhizobium sp.]
MFRHASLSRRLLLAAMAFIAVALVVAAVAVGFALHRFVQGQIDQRLDSQVTFLSSMLRAGDDGRLSLTGNADGPPFERRRRGWYWQVMGPRNALRSQSLDGADLDVPDASEIMARPPPPPTRGDRPPKDGRPKDGQKDGQKDRPRPGDGRGPDDEQLHYRIQQVTVSGTPATIVVSAPRGAVWGPLREAMTTLAISLGVLGTALVLAIMLQVRLGLRPLERLRQSVADVRAGRSERVPARQPLEVQPLVSELNGLLDQNAANLERARRHVANLAHGLKTPLATLALSLSNPDVTRADQLVPMVDQMERRIRHHLGRARAAVLSGPVRTRTVIAPRIRDLGDVLTKVHAERNIALTVTISDDVVLACEPQDFDEMAGNLMENAFKWASRRVDIRAMPDSTMVRLIIEDDGSGLRPEEIEKVLRPGERLDESAPGFGFGLSITRELAELYGGSIAFGASDLGGLRVSLSLPRAV